ncbi:uncharacterized protein LDX57_008654 [Aspergillus melleus]|uniref:uncharacterized protein n=1 Tax=Aspergillus melleus TaxID=138277 RepID=UPI001E8ED808|nr:uncharacterized protein LDX57_008654 [Aspergillus melleus]KAH8430993.1 hypothetical protein LDX57_008654 [Aspergillus melleus]
MAETVGFVSALLGLTILTFDASKTLYEAVSSFRSQRRTIRDLQLDLSSLLDVLQSIRDLAESSHESDRLEALRLPMECCLAICQDLQVTLDSCTKHSDEGRDSIRDWLSLRYHEKSFEDMKKRLASYKATLSITFQLITLGDLNITRDSIQNLENTIQGTKEDLDDQLEQVRETISGADVSTRNILQTDLAQLQSSMQSLQSSIASLEQVKATLPTLTITGNQAESSRAIFGTDTHQPSFNMNVSNNAAMRGSVIAAGVHTPGTLQALLRDTSTPHVALALRAVQGQSHSSNIPISQSVLRSMSAENSSLVDSTILADGPPRNMIEASSTSHEQPNEDSRVVRFDILEHQSRS